MPRAKNDSFFKRSLEHTPIAQAFFSQHLPAHLKPLVALDRLQRVDRTSTDAQLKQRHRDISYEAPLEEHNTLLLCAEHQGKPELMMLVRLLRYDADGIETYVQKHQKWPVVVNIVFTQAPAWPSPSTTQEAYERPALGVQELSIRYHLVQIQNYSDQEVLSHGWCAPMELLIKHSESGNFELGAKAYRTAFEACLEEVGEGYLETMLTYAVSLSRPEAGKKMFDFISEVLIDKKDMIMTYGQQLRQEGMQKGMQQGMQRGIQQVAKSLLSQLHLDLKAVQKATGLSQEELERLQKEE
ncbi:MAG: Rpn family recombination-promoting nuclease/putative transposase [Roseivirga sp.]